MSLADTLEALAGRIRSRVVASKTEVRQEIIHALLDEAPLHGGQQERGRRGGTENVAGIVGLGRAAELARDEVSTYAETVRPLRDRLENELLARVPGAERNGRATERLPNTSNLTFPGVESEALLLLLDQAGICASAGSACVADSDEPSHVVRAMKPEGGASRQMVRLSLRSRTTAEEIDQAVEAVVRAAATLRRAR